MIGQPASKHKYGGHIARLDDGNMADMYTSYRQCARFDSFNALDRAAVTPKALVAHRMRR